MQEGDALEYIAAAARDGKQYDIVLLDAYNGANRVPPIFTKSGQPDACCEHMSMAFHCSMHRRHCEQIAAMQITDQQSCKTGQAMQYASEAHGWMMHPYMPANLKMHVQRAKWHPNVGMLHADSSFIPDLAAVLQPEHGTFLMNLHGGKLPNPLVQLAQSFSADPMAGAGFDPSTREGDEVSRLSSMYR